MAQLHGSGASWYPLRLVRRDEIGRKLAGGEEADPAAEGAALAAKAEADALRALLAVRGEGAIAAAACELMQTFEELWKQSCVEVRSGSTHRNKRIHGRELD